MKTIYLLVCLSLCSSFASAGEVMPPMGRIGFNNEFNPLLNNVVNKKSTSHSISSLYLKAPSGDTCVPVFNYRYRGSSFCDLVRNFSETKDGNFMAFGSMREIKNDPGTSKGTLTKFDKNGLILSAKKISTADAYFQDIFLLKDSALMIPTGQNGKLMLNKLDEDFNIIWTKSFDPGGKHFSYNGMVQAADSSFYVLISYNNPYPPYIALLKFSKDGDFLWQKNYIANDTFSGFQNSQLVELKGAVYISTNAYAGNHYPMTVILKLDGTNGAINWINYYNNPLLKFDGDYRLFTVNDRLALSRIVSSGSPLYQDYPTVIFINQDGSVEKTKIFKSDLYIFSPFISVVKAMNGDLVFPFVAYDFSVSPYTSNYGLLRTDSDLNILSSTLFAGQIYNFQGPLKEASDGNFYSAVNIYYDDPYEGDFSFRKFTPDLKGGNCASFTFTMKDSLIEVHATADKLEYAPNLVMTEVYEPFVLQPYDLSFREDLCDLKIKCDEIKLAGPQLICSSKDTVTYSVKRNAGCTAPTSFTIDPAYGKIVYSNDSSVRILFGASGETKLYAQINLGCTMILDSILISVKLSGDSIDLGPDPAVCGPVQYALDAGDGFNTYLWQDGSTGPMFTATSPGTYYVKATNFCGQIYTDTVTISAAVPDPISVGGDAFKCNKDTVIITATAGFPSYQWSNNTQVLDEASNKLTIAPTTTGKYYVRAEKSPGCISIDSITITVYTTPDIQLGKDTSLCFSESLLLDTGPGFAQYAWSAGQTTRQISVNQAGRYSIKASDLNGCYSTDTFDLLKVHPLPQISLNKTPFICSGTSKELNAGSGFSSYLWNDGSSMPSQKVFGIGKYFVTVSDLNGCIGSDTSEIKSIAPLPSKFLQKDTAICSYETLEVQSLLPFNEYLWSTGDYTKEITLKSPGNYWLQVRDNNGCEAKEYIKVMPKECAEGIYFPNAFTPNNDFKNDTYNPIVFGKMIQFDFIIFNRFGQIIFRSNDPSRGWDGNLKGAPQEIGFYVWTCTYQFQDKLLKNEKGTVNLIR